MARKKQAMAVDAPAYHRTKADIERDRKWAAEEAMRTLTRADEIKKDNRLMNDVKKLAKEQMKTAQKFCK